jgi:hypothetical protein
LVLATYSQLPKNEGLPLFDDPEGVVCLVELSFGLGVLLSSAAFEDGAGLR